MRSRRYLVALIAAVVATTAARASGVEFRGVGPRVGASDNPDQFVAGVQFDLGEFAKNVRWQPSVELGFGDHKTSLYGNFMVAYYFPVKAAVTPYAGAEAVLWLFDNDGNRDPQFDDGFNTQIGLAAVGGIETRVGRGTTRFLAELQLRVVSDMPDAKIMVGWTF
jgi:hypothetical protein